tara:strand:- start:679 stop:933 length:255 start_codon:yes stop_codon:yes gene_type:complete
LIKVEVRKGQSVDKALKIFKRRVKDSGIMFDLKERSFYKKPSAIKREQRNKAKLRAKYEKIKKSRRLKIYTLCMFFFYKLDIYN